MELPSVKHTFLATLLAGLSILPCSSSTPLDDHEALLPRQAYAMGGLGFTAPNTTLGNQYSYWKKFPNGIIDLTRSDIMPVTRPKLLRFTGSRPAALIEPSRSVLCLIDMQNFFLHPALRPGAKRGRAIVPAMANAIDAFRAAGVKIAWVNWGLTNYDLLTMPPALLSSFSNNGSDLANETFGSDMGSIQDNGVTVSMGKLLMRGAWNAEPWGELRNIKDTGLAKGTDVYFNKNRLSGLWGAQTPFGMWLQENEMSTIFFGGVNTDQCVWGTLLDAFYKGYDVVFVDDLSATSSPQYATQMALHNADGNGFICNSTDIIPDLKSGLS